MPVGSRAKRWTFTLNNPTEEDEQRLGGIVSGGLGEYLVYGRELAPDTGTPHLQGYVIWSSAIRFTTCKNRLGGNCHVEVASRSPETNRNYCTKDGDYAEFGTCPERGGGQGRRNDLEEFYKWSDEFCASNGRPPSTPEVARAHPAVYTKYPRVVPICRLRFEGPSLVGTDEEPFQWQQDLADELEGNPSQRSIIFYVDPEGNKGKSWFQRWYYGNHRENTQLLSVAKRDDLAHAISPSKSVFLFNVPRGAAEFLQYPILESLKDGWIFSPKYQSMTKFLNVRPHVVVFMNEDPDMEKLTNDRYDIRIIDDEDVQHGINLN